MNAREHLRRQDILHNTPYVIPPSGLQGYKYNGLIIPRSVFVRKFQVPEEVHVHEKGEKKYIKNWAKQ